MSSSLRKKYSKNHSYDDSSKGPSRSLADNFDLKSEYYEENIKVSKRLLESEEDIITNVKVHKQDSIVEINAKDIKKVIRENKDIKQIVVEKISLEEASRYSLLFAPKENNQGLLEDHKKNYTVEGETSKKWSILSLQDYLNEEFIGAKESQKTNRSDIESSVVSLKDEQNHNKNNLLPFSSQESEDEHLDKNLKYQKHTLTKKKNRDKTYYYRAKDHMELYKVGSSYLKDFKDGEKSFSFSSNGISKEREKTVFGICSFFNYHEGLSICIVTGNLKEAFYNEMCDSFSREKIPVFDEGFSLPIQSASGFDIIEYRDLKKVERKIKDYDFETFIEFITDHYDLVLWDLPELSILDSNKELYFPIIRSLDSVSFVIKKDTSKISEIGKMISYFNRYQVDIKGLLYSEDVEHCTERRAS